MIGILLNDSAYEQDIRELLMAFYPGQTFAHEMQEDLDFFVEGTVNEERTEFTLCLGYFGSSSFHLLSVEKLEPEIRAEFQAAENSVLKVNYENRFETKNKIKRRLYVLLMQQTGKQLPWGTLTGIRPTKIAMTKLAEGETPEQIFRHMKDTYFTSDEKLPRENASCFRPLIIRKATACMWAFPSARPPACIVPLPLIRSESGRTALTSIWMRCSKNWIMWQKRRRAARWTPFILAEEPRLLFLRKIWTG